MTEFLDTSIQAFVWIGYALFILSNVVIDYIFSVPQFVRVKNESEADSTSAPDTTVVLTKPSLLIGQSVLEGVGYGLWIAAGFRQAPELAAASSNVSENSVRAVSATFGVLIWVFKHGNVWLHYKGAYTDRAKYLRYLVIFGYFASFAAFTGYVIAYERNRSLLNHLMGGLAPVVCIAIMDVRWDRNHSTCHHWGLLFLMAIYATSLAFVAFAFTEQP